MRQEGNIKFYKNTKNWSMSSKVKKNGFTARQFLLIGRCRNLKPEQVFNTANRIEKVVSEQGFETHRMKKEEIKRFLAVYFEASMNGDQMPDTDGEQFFDGEDSDEEEA